MHGISFLFGASKLCFVCFHLYVNSRVEITYCQIILSDKGILATVSQILPPFPAVGTGNYCFRLDVLLGLQGRFIFCCVEPTVGEVMPNKAQASCKRIQLS